MNHIIFKGDNRDFTAAVTRRVDAYFKTNKIKKSGNAQLFFKTALFIPLAIVVYFVLLFAGFEGIGQILLWVFFGGVLSLIGINIMHDANHGSYGEKRWINNLMGLTMNALGSNAFLWKTRHSQHHTFTNVTGVDNDIDNMPWLRQSPEQPWKPMHRFQYIYMFPLYSIGTLQWFVLTDFLIYFSRKISINRIKTISLREHIIFWGSKVLAALVYIILPAIFLGWQEMLLGFLIIHVTMGFNMILLFQLAHVMENTHFVSTEPETHEIKSEWAIHELKTTTNFATDNKLVTWLVGGLNYQIEHHLFPSISHVHYPAISKIIRDECARFQLPYNNYPSVTRAVISHIRFMKQLGRKHTASAN